MFDVYSQTQTARGQLVERAGDALLYANKQLIQEDGKLINIRAGQSYELIVSDEGDPLSINFEESDGAGDGVSTELVLKMLYHRESALLEENFSESKSLTVRAIKMAIDSLSPDDCS